MKQESKPELSKWHTYGNHLYRRPGEVAAVLFTNETYGIRKLIVDNNGDIQDFPGVEGQEEWKPAWAGGTLDNRIRFYTDFTRLPDGTIRMVWQIQPDGRYWEDEYGFGGEPDEEICLYTYLDEKGNFTAPFRTYNVGIRRYV